MSDLIMSYPKVDADGREYGGEVTFKFSKLTAVQRMSNWHYIRENPEDGLVERYRVVPGCCTIYIDREDFNIKAEYEEVVAKLKEYNEMYG